MTSTRRGILAQTLKDGVLVAAFTTDDIDAIKQCIESIEVTGAVATVRLPSIQRTLSSDDYLASPFASPKPDKRKR